MDLRERLESTCALAKAELQKSSERYRKYYNKKSKNRKLKPGDSVLILLPTDQNKLLMHWKGPFTVLDKVGEASYVVEVNGRRKSFHANLLKEYITRESPNVFAASVLSMSEAEEQESCFEIPQLQTSQTETAADVVINEALNEGQTNEVKCLLTKFTDVMSDVPGRTNVIECDIKVTTDEPIKTKPYPLPFATRETVQAEIQKMIQLGVVEPSNSPYSSPVVLVPKPDGSKRFCIDFRNLNKVTVYEAEPMQTQDDIFSKLSSDNYFSRVDLTKGYWQVPMACSAKEKTAFATPEGLWQFTTMPFGLVQGPAVFTKLMRRVFRDVPNVDNYLDDILVHTKTWEEHVKTIEVVLEKLRESGLTARPSKCAIGYTKLEFLGHTIEGGKLGPKQSTLDKIQGAERPKTKTQVRSFLGLTGYYRDYIPNYSAVAAPLTDLTRNGRPNKVEWGSAQEKAFKDLKGALVSPLLLRLPDVKKEFVLRTDASDVGIGAVLLQEHEGELFPVSYASRKLLPRERNYSVIERECLGLVWAVQKFYVYLYGKEFILQTDHEPLVYLNKAKLLNSRIMRWALVLQEYRFTLQSIKGKHNVGADYMSRM